MNGFIAFAVDETIIPRTTNIAPMIATHRRPMISDMDPTKGQTPARARRYARTLFEISMWILREYFHGDVQTKSIDLLHRYLCICREEYHLSMVNDARAKAAADDLPKM